MRYGDLLQNNPVGQETVGEGRGDFDEIRLALIGNSRSWEVDKQGFMKLFSLL